MPKIDFSSLFPNTKRRTMEKEISQAFEEYFAGVAG
jgi:hypothetical protein